MYSDAVTVMMIEAYTLPRSEESYTAFIAGAILNKIAPQY
jgi:hypothetical protein